MEVVSNVSTTNKEASARELAITASDNTKMHCCWSMATSKYTPNCTTALDVAFLQLFHARSIVCVGCACVDSTLINHRYVAIDEAGIEQCCSKNPRTTNPYFTLDRSSVKQKVAQDYDFACDPSTAQNSRVLSAVRQPCQTVDTAHRGRKVSPPALCDSSNPAGDYGVTTYTSALMDVTNLSRRTHVRKTLPVWTSRQQYHRFADSLNVVLPVIGKNQGQDDRLAGANGREGLTATLPQVVKCNLRWQRTSRRIIHSKALAQLVSSFTRRCQGFLADVETIRPVAFRVTHTHLPKQNDHPAQLVHTRGPTWWVAGQGTRHQHGVSHGPGLRLFQGCAVRKTPLQGGYGGRGSCRHPTQAHKGRA